jgi:hypothetical protein
MPLSHRPETGNHFALQRVKRRSGHGCNRDPDLSFPRSAVAFTRPTPDWSARSSTATPRKRAASSRLNPMVLQVADRVDQDLIGRPRLVEPGAPAAKDIGGRHDQLLLPLAAFAEPLGYLAAPLSRPGRSAATLPSARPVAVAVAADGMVGGRRRRGDSGVVAVIMVFLVRARCASG